MLDQIFLVNVDCKTLGPWRILLSSMRLFEKQFLRGFSLYEKCVVVLTTTNSCWLKHHLLTTYSTWANWLDKTRPFSRDPHDVDITMTVFLSGDVCDCHCSICVYVDSDDSWMYAEGSRYRYHILSQSYPRPTRLYAGKDGNIIIHKNGNVLFLIVRLSNNLYLIYILLDGSNVLVRFINLPL